MTGEEDDTHDTAEAAIQALERAAARANPSPPQDARSSPAVSSPPPPRAPTPDPLEELARLADQLRPEPRRHLRLGPLTLALLALLLVSLGALAATRLS